MGTKDFSIINIKCVYYLYWHNILLDVFSFVTNLNFISSLKGNTSMQFNLFSLLLYVWFYKMVLQIILVNNIMWAKSNIHEKPSLFVLPLPCNFNAFTIHVNRLHYTHLSAQKVAWDLDVCSISQGVSNFLNVPKMILPMIWLARDMVR